MNKDTNNFQPQKAKISKSKQPILFNLSGLGNKGVEIKFTMEKTSNDGGLLLLREVEKQVDLISGLANCIKDGRHQSYIEHSIKSMMRSRFFRPSFNRFKSVGYFIS